MPQAAYRYPELVIGEPGHNVAGSAEKPSRFKLRMKFKCIHYNKTPLFMEKRGVLLEINSTSEWLQGKAGPKEARLAL